MTRFDLHPDDLLERASRGTLHATEVTRVTQHLAECAVCRVERALMLQAALDAAPLRDEKLLVARLTREVTRRVITPAGAHAKRKGAFIAIALAAATAASMAAAATAFVVMRGTAGPPAVSAPQPGERPPPAGPDAGAGRLQTVEPSGSAVGEMKAEGPSGKPNASQHPRRAPATLEPLSSSELFSRANQARREGKAAEAVRLYRALQERFSGTSEELVSRVSLGRLLLDRLGDSRGALVQFNSYLASPGGGVLREEAMVGRALALGRMGRAAEERAAWQALLETFPRSTQRKRAQARLVELGGSTPGGVRTGTGTGGAERAQ